jgi:hypothetical protein
MAKRKFKFEYRGLEITSSEIMDFQELIKLFSYAALWERHLQHLKECNEFEILADDVLKKIEEQINAEV